MADGYARASRKFGVCVGISGPGTMNFVPGMTAGHADRIPMLYIAGGVSSRAEGKGAFQDATLSGIFESGVVRSLVRNVVELKNKDNLQAEMRRATDGLNWMHRAQSFISIPVDVQQHEVLPDQEVSRQQYDHGAFNASEVPANNNYANGAIHIDAISNGSIPEQFTRLPRHDWTAFAASVGVAARMVEHLDDLADALSEASRVDGPFLIEVMTGVFPAPNRYYAECATCT